MCKIMSSGSIAVVPNGSHDYTVCSYCSFIFPQFMHPYQAEHYREVARALRVIGRNCIQSRVKALENGEEIPLDILSHILKMASMCSVHVFPFIKNASHLCRHQ